MFRYIGRSQVALDKRATRTAPAILWQEIPAGGGVQRNFFVRPVQGKRYHLRIIVGSVITTDRREALKREVVGAARLMGITLADSHWAEVDSLVS